MVDAALTITSTTRYPTFESKAAFMLAFEQNLKQGGNNPDKWYEILLRLSNTNTVAWPDTDARHDD